MKTLRYICLLATFALGAVGSNPAVAGNPKCPDGTSLVAKFEWSGSSYVFEKPRGNQGLVSLSGSASAATWSSQVDISTIVLKAARDSEEIGTDVAGGTANLELVESDFTPGAMTARFRYRRINFTQNTYVRVVATDLCDQRQCPDTDQFPDFSPAVVINGQGGFATGYALHPDGLQSLEFFRLNNVAVTQNTFIQGEPRADFTVTRLDPMLPTGYGFIAATSCNATVIDPSLDYSGTGALGMAAWSRSKWAATCSTL